MHSNETENGNELLKARAATTRKSLTMDDGLQFEEWRSIGRVLSNLSDASRWWLGDWLIYGEASFPSRYRHAADQTSLGYQTLRNYAWVARAISADDRCADLSFQHHAEVAALEQDVRTRWLERARRFGWTRNMLRNRLRASRRSGPAELQAENVRLEVSVQGGQHLRWQEAADEAHMSLQQWVVVSLDRVASGNRWQEESQRAS